MPLLMPTLLIGVGGLGCKVINQVYDMAMTNSANSQNLTVHGFDTDTNDLSKLKALKGHLTQIGGDLTVEDALMESGSPAWFPRTEGDYDLLQKSLDVGAGQARAVSALCWYHALRWNGLNRLYKDINSLFRVTGTDIRPLPRVVIVSSVAGGSGSGIFLQVALHVYKHIEEKYGKKPKVHGVFFLPDVVCNTALSDEDQREAIRANAYACLKELNGMVSLMQGPNAVEFAYTFPQKKPKVNKKPYDSVLLIDYGNTHGDNLGEGEEALARYVDQAAHIVFTRLTETGKKITSKKDNILRKMVASRGLALYESAGFSRLVYPYEDIARYCGAKMLQESLQGQWLHIDDQFVQYYQQYVNDLKNGVPRPQEPRLSEFFVEQLDQLGTGSGASNFFRQIYWQTHRVDKEGNVTDESLHAYFLAAIKAEVARVLMSNQQYRTCVNIPRPRSTALKQLSDGETQAKMEEYDGTLRLLKKTVDSLVQSAPTSILVSVLKAQAIAGREQEVTKEEFRLNTWLLHNPHNPKAMHPVAIRYFLYRLQESLGAELDKLRTKNDELKAAIEFYFVQGFDRKDTEEVEDLSDRIDYELGQKGWFGFGRKGLKEFIPHYTKIVGRQCDNLKEYAQGKILEQVFKDLLDGVYDLSQGLKKFFDGLKDTLLHLSADIAAMKTEHDSATGPALGLDTTQGDAPSCFYVGADREQKERIWKEASGTAELKDDQMAQLWKELYLNIYFNYAASKRWSGNQAEVAPLRQEDFIDPLRSKMTDVFLEHDKIRRTLPQVLDDLAHEVFPHNDAKDKQRRQRGLVAIVARVREGARPWIAVERRLNPAGSGFNPDSQYWSTHKAQADDNAPDDWGQQFKGDVNAIFPTGDARVGQPDYSPYELTCFRSMVGLRLTDLRKFQEGGAYAVAYENLMDSLNDKSLDAITPHLYSNWHIPKVLPEIDAESAAQKALELRLAFLYGLLSGQLVPRKEGRRSVWYFRPSDKSDGSDVTVNGQQVQGSYDKLYEALDANRDMVDQLLAIYRLQGDKANGKQAQKHPFYLGCEGKLKPPVGAEEFAKRNIFDHIAFLAAENKGNTAMRERGAAMLGTCIDMVVDYYKEYCYADNQSDIAQSEAVEFLEQLAGESQKLQSNTYLYNICEDRLKFLAANEEAAE